MVNLKWLLWIRLGMHLAMWVMNLALCKLVPSRGSAKNQEINFALLIHFRDLTSSILGSASLSNSSWFNRKFFDFIS